MLHDHRVQINRTKTVLDDIHDRMNVVEIDPQVLGDVLLKTRVESKKIKVSKYKK